jgi:hypothetical protein
MLDIQQAFLRRLDEFEVVRPSRSAGGQRRYSRVESLASSREALHAALARREALLARRAHLDR